MPAIPRQRLLEAGAQVETLARPADDRYYPELVDRYRRVRRFLPALLRSVSFESTQAGKAMLDALDFLRRIEPQRHPDMQQAPLDVVPGAWRRLVKPACTLTVNRQAYTLCIVERLQDHLRRRDIFVSRSERWGDPRIKLLQGEQWEGMRPHGLPGFGPQRIAAAGTPRPQPTTRCGLSTHRSPVFNE